MRSSSTRSAAIYRLTESIKPTFSDGATTAIILPIAGSDNRPGPTRLAFVKAAFSRRDKEGWITIPGLWEMLSSLEKARGPPRERILFEPHELRAVIEAADLGLKATIMLALNAGLGNSDIGEAQWKHITTKRIGKQVETRFVMPRGKTWGRRRTPLWPETIPVLERWRKQRRKDGFRPCAGDRRRSGTGRAWIIESKAKKREAR